MTIDDNLFGRQQRFDKSDILCSLVKENSHLRLWIMDMWKASCLFCKPKMLTSRYITRWSKNWVFKHNYKTYFIVYNILSYLSYFHLMLIPSWDASQWQNIKKLGRKKKKSLVTNDGNDKEIFNTFCTNLHPVSPSIEFELKFNQTEIPMVFEFHSMYINLILFYEFNIRFRLFAMTYKIFIWIEHNFHSFSSSLIECGNTKPK